MKQLRHISLIILLLIIGFVERQPAAATTSEETTGTGDTAAIAVMDSAIARFVQSPAMRNADIGICVTDIRTGKPVAGHDIDRKLIPASVTKLVTSATALKRLGGDFKFRTRVKCSGGITPDGVLEGNLIIEGGIDPTLESRHFPEQESFVSATVATLKLWGVKSIRGQIKTVERIKQSQSVPSSWMDADIAEDYGAGIHSINYNDNLFSLIIDTSGGRAKIVDTIPHIKSISIDNRMQVGRKGKFSPNAHRKKNSKKLTLSGTLRRIDEPIEIVTPMPAPSEGLRADLRETLEAEGIAIKGEKLDVDDNESFQVLSYESPALSEILRSLLTRSDNMYAEAVLRKLGEQSYDSPTREKGIKAEQTILTHWGVDTGEVTLYDGSGLGRANRFSSRFLSDVLRATARDWQCGEQFPPLLPAAGKEGTVRSLLKGTPLAGHIGLKSGSMNGVRCYAGYYPAQCPRYAITLMINGYRCNGEQLRNAIERLLVDMFAEMQLKDDAKRLAAQRQ